MNYSIIIPLHNEEKTLNRLLIELKPFSKNNEIIIINDGSSDSSAEILNSCSYIKLINLRKNYGKGFAIKVGLKKANYNKILITDGDLELKTNELENLMILNSKKSIFCVFGSRYEKINPFNSFWNFGNFFLTKLFNLLYDNNFPDALCCAKSFFINDINLNLIKSNKFDIDIELAITLIKKHTQIIKVPLTYQRRAISQGKKIRYWDSYFIFLRIIKSL